MGPENRTSSMRSNGCSVARAPRAARQRHGRRDLQRLAEPWSAGTAEATIIFDNSTGALPVDTPEVRVTRRVFRSGEAEYLINNQPCRLKDVKDLIRGTGIGIDAYSLIEQGKVDRMLQANAKDRRAIFEEAAGSVASKPRRSKPNVDSREFSKTWYVWATSSTKWPRDCKASSPKPARLNVIAKPLNVCANCARSSLGMIGRCSATRYRQLKANSLKLKPNSKRSRSSRSTGDRTATDRRQAARDRRSSSCLGTTARGPRPSNRDGHGSQGR